MSGKIEHSASVVCPICGYKTNDWCGYSVGSNQDVYYFCQRIHKAHEVGSFYNESDKTLTSGIDGVSYRCIKETSAGFFVFVEKKDAFYTPQKRPQLPVKSQTESVMFMQSDDVLDRVYRCLLEQLILEDVDEQYLVKEGWSKEQIAIAKNTYMFRSMPPEDFIRFGTIKDETANQDERRYYESLRNKSKKRIVDNLIKELGMTDFHGVPGFYKKGDAWKFSCLEGLLMPTMNAYGEIVRLRVRINHQTKMRLVKGKNIPSEDTEGLAKALSHIGKYYPAQSSKKEGGTGAPTRLSYYGMEFQEAYQEGLEDRVIITEGEKKAFIASQTLSKIVIALPGIKNTSRLEKEAVFSLLDSIGVTRITVAFDMDFKTNADVRREIVKLIKLIQSHGFVAEFANWDDVKGLDEALLAKLKVRYTTIT